MSTTATDTDAYCPCCSVENNHTYRSSPWLVHILYGSPLLVLARTWIGLVMTIAESLFDCLEPHLFSVAFSFFLFIASAFPVVPLFLCCCQDSGWLFYFVSAAEKELANGCRAAMHLKPLYYITLCVWYTALYLFILYGTVLYCTTLYYW